MCAMNMENCLFYHEYFKDNKANFIEAPVGQIIEKYNIYVSCYNKKFFYSVKYFFEKLTSPNNVVFKGMFYILLVVFLMSLMKQKRCIFR